MQKGKNMLAAQLDVLSESATDGFAVSYIHTDPKIDSLFNKGGYGLYGRTEPGEPTVFSEEWWNIWTWFSGECAKRGVAVGLDDYTVGWTPETDGKVYVISTEDSYILHPEYGKALVDVYFNRFEQKMTPQQREGMNYYRPVYEWHAERGLMYGSDNLGRGRNPLAYVDYFRANSWYTAPGNDAPSKGSSFIQTKVSSSIAHLYQRPRTWLEAFHSMGWGSSGEWLTQQIDHHFMAGGNLVCMHGLYYSTHGGWWEWAPPCFHFRMPYWPHMKGWLEYTERMSYPTESMQAYPDSQRKLSGHGTFGYACHASCFAGKAP